MKYHTLFFQKLGMMSQNLSSAAIEIGALMVKSFDHILSAISKGNGDLTRVLALPLIVAVAEAEKVESSSVVGAID